MKICFVASSGGHLEELFCLKEIAENNESVLITETSDFKEIQFCSKQYYVPQINRKERRFYLHFFQLIFRSITIIKTEKPQIIIATGALVSFPFCLIGKLFGAKICYIESFARVNKPSLTGRLVYFFADLFIIQWEELKKYYRNSVYVGSLF